MSLGFRSCLEEGCSDWLLVVVVFDDFCDDVEAVLASASRLASISRNSASARSSRLRGLFDRS